MVLSLSASAPNKNGSGTYTALRESDDSTQVTMAVRVEGSGSAVQLLACGGIRIAGELEFVGPGVPIPPLQHGAAFERKSLKPGLC